MNAVLLAFMLQALALAAATAAIGGAAGRRLGLALMVLAGMMAVFPLGATGRADPPPVAAFFPLNLPLALGPLLYGYIHQLATGRAMPREALHFLPALLQLAYAVAVLCLPAADGYWWKEVGHDNWVKPIVEGAVILSLGGYSIAGLRLLRRYRAWLVQNRSDAELYAARWLGRLLGALLMLVGVFVPFRIYVWFFAELDTGPFHSWLAIVSAWLGIEGLRHAERLFPPMRPPDSDARDAAVRDWGKLGREWKEATEQAGWWREADLSLPDLARRLGTNSSYLSRAINEGLGINFNAFINRMRAADVERHLVAPDWSGDLLTLALDSGFSSKATFNRAFRAAYGASPSEYRRLKS